MPLMPNCPDYTVCEYCRPVPFSCELCTEPSASTKMWRMLGFVDKLLISQQRRCCELLVGCLRIILVFILNGLRIVHTAVKVIR